MADPASELARQSLQGTRLRQLQNKQLRQVSSASDNAVSGTFVGYSADNTPLVRLQNGALVPISQTASGGAIQDERVCLARNGGELISSGEVVNGDPASDLARQAMQQTRAREQARKANSPNARRNQLSYEFAGYDAQDTPQVAVDSRVVIPATQFSNGSIQTGEKIAPFRSEEDLFIRGRDSVDPPPRRRTAPPPPSVNAWLSRFFGGVITTSETPTGNSLSWLSRPGNLISWGYFYNPFATPIARLYNFNTDFDTVGFETRSIGAAVRIITIQNPTELQIDFDFTLVQPLTTFGTSEGSPVSVPQPSGATFGLSMQVWKINPGSPMYTTPFETWDDWATLYKEQFFVPGTNLDSYYINNRSRLISEYVTNISQGTPIELYGDFLVPNDSISLNVPFSNQSLSPAYVRGAIDYDSFVTAISSYSLQANNPNIRSNDLFIEPWFDIRCEGQRQLTSYSVLYNRGFTSTAPPSPLATQTINRYAAIPDGIVGQTYMDAGVYLVQIQLVDTTPSATIIYTNSGGQFSYIGAQTLQNQFDLAMEFKPYIPPTP